MNGRNWITLLRDYPVTTATLAVTLAIVAVVAIMTTLPADDVRGASDQVAAPTATAEATVAATATAEATTEATATPAETATPAPDDPVAQGKVVYETAAGVGCIFCHGATGRGDGAANQGAPDIRGFTKAQIQGALAGGVPLMGFIKLTTQELRDVSAYVKYLGEQ